MHPRNDSEEKQEERTEILRQDYSHFGSSLISKGNKEFPRLGRFGVAGSGGIGGLKSASLKPPRCRSSDTLRRPIKGAAPAGRERLRGLGVRY